MDTLLSCHHIQGHASAIIYVYCDFAVAMPKVEPKSGVKRPPLIRLGGDAKAAKKAKVAGGGPQPPPFPPPPAAPPAGWPSHLLVPPPPPPVVVKDDDEMEEVVEEIPDIEKAQQEAASRQTRDPVMCLGFEFNVIDASVEIMSLRILQTVICKHKQN